MYFYKCPNCLDIWYSETQYDTCKCFKCGTEYEPTPIYVEDWIKSAIERCRG